MFGSNSLSTSENLMKAPTRFRLLDGYSQVQIEVILAERHLAETPLAQSLGVDFNQGE